ncbi:hypothetical protein [Bradyrhizobium sp. NP1]|uniref:hypothetical protein n=1 Tax=Bradyrhizobium sp. NP1 TaxID=3049772 RepID=UPI0025A5FF29|nr:hypothetical protein [Bradyrhizobium sp. NP1]WJR77342.1 hypothetical protein QOU61_32200 [Bradyrhizobium sp. NP1]
MSKQPPAPEFGKRRPAAPARPAPTPTKRSGHVGLLLMGTFAVGGAAYALMPSETCQPPQPAMAAPATPAAATACTSRSSSGGGSSSRTSRFSFYGGDSSSSRTASAGSADSGSGVTRGGFGSIAHAFGFSGRG